MRQYLNAGLGKAPIPGDAPAGWDVRNDPDFDLLSAEIDKLSSPTFSGGVDWDRISDIAGRISEEKSKDLLVMVYLCLALLKTEGMKGLAQGIHVLREALETYWEDMFPSKKRMRGRKNALEWLIDNLRSEIPAIQQETWGGPEREFFLGDLNAVDQFLSENMEDAPVFLPLINEISSRVVQAEQEGKENVPPADRPLAGQPAGPTPSIASVADTAILADLNGDNVEKWLDQGLDILDRVATFLIQQDPLHHTAYRLSRIAAWTAVTDLPAVTGSKTLIPGPDSDIVNTLQNLYQSRNWKDLLQSAESRVRQYLFWFDLSRYAAESLEQLGAPIPSAAVAMETLQYVQRLPGIERMAFENGQPFADEQTRAWLQGLHQERSGAGEGKASSCTDPIQQAVEEALNEARKQTRENKGSDAVRHFYEAVKNASSEKERFLWQHGLSHVLLDMKQPRLAFPYLQDMLAAMDTYKIEQWEPALAVDALTTILMGLRLQPDKDPGQLDAILNRLTRLDPIKAMDFL